MFGLGVVGMSLGLVACSGEEEYADTVEYEKILQELDNDLSTEIDKFFEEIEADLQNEDTVESNDVPIEYMNALQKAENYSEVLFMSKKGIYKQLTSEYGGKFSHDAANYAIEALSVDYRENALKKAERYYIDLGMSKQAVYDQLVSDYGAAFTPEEAQYAVDRLVE